MFKSYYAKNPKQLLCMAPAWAAITAYVAVLGAPLSANAADKITDNYGNSMDHVQWNYEGDFADKSRVASNSLALKLTGHEPFGSVRGEAHGCSIGSKAISDGQVALLLNNLPEISVVAARHGFNTVLMIANPDHLDGVVQCSQIGIFLSPAREQLVFGTVTGALTLAPAWINGTGRTITSLVFNFDGLVAQSHAHSDVDSAQNQVKLVNAIAYPATIFVMRPAQCKIGPMAVQTRDIYFMNNGTVIARNQNIAVASHGVQTYALRFAAAGGYGKASGAVTCAENGALTYTY